MSEIPITLANSFEQVFREREAEVLRTAYRIVGNWADAEDVAQETFARLHKQGMRFPNDIALRSWLYRVAVNLCLDRARSRRRYEEVPEAIASSDSVEANAIRHEQREMLMAALATLPPRERAAVVLREIEGLATTEVAEILGSSDGTIRSQVAKGIGKLRSMLSGAKR